MGIFGKGEAKLYSLDYMPANGLRTNRTLSAKLGQPEHVEPKVCGVYDWEGKRGATTYRRVRLD